MLVVYSRHAVAVRDVAVGAGDGAGAVVFSPRPAAEWVRGVDAGGAAAGAGSGGGRGGPGGVRREEEGAAGGHDAGPSGRVDERRAVRGRVRGAGPAGVPAGDAGAGHGA